MTCNAGIKSNFPGIICRFPTIILDSAVSVLITGGQVDSMKESEL
jgi:hypothetical protein